MAEGDTILRAAQPCPVCRTPITSRGQGDANRTTYWCPRCPSAVDRCV